VGQTKTTIELNGNLYDANTGAMLTTAPKNQAQPALKPAPRGGVVDGFFRGPAPVVIKPSSPAKPRATANKTGHKTEKSHTLMRHVVHKPQVAAPAIKPNQVKEKGLPAPESFWQDRKRRAQQISKSASISRFGSGNPISKKVAPLAVKAHPDDVKSDIKKAPPMPPKTDVATVSASTKTFQDALQNAQTHKQAKLHKAKRRHRAAKKLGVSARALNIASITLVVVLLTGFVAYQSAPGLSLRLASSQAGFHAALPGYTPSGFGIAGPIKAAPGVVSISFRSHSDDRSFNVNQRQSNWTSESLLSNFVASNKSYQALEDKGKTIFVYNGNNATWVNGGIWYQVVGNANLSNDQLLHIADSL
jgi:hypothetical protein